MDNETRREIEALKAQVEALTRERIPTVDRASKRRDKRQVLAGFGLFAVAVTIAGTMSASALSGTNTVDSGDIVDGTITSSDIKSDSILGSRVRNDSLTGADINESTLALPLGYEVVKSSPVTLTHNAAVTFSASCPDGKVAVGGGVETNPDGRSIVQGSYPSEYSHQLWYSSVYNKDNAFTLTVTPYAVCINSR